MLEQAANKLHRKGLDTSGASARFTRPAENVEFLRHQALALPFPDAAFDVVCCLEVLELFPNMDEPLAELTRVLRPGGVLLSSRGTEASGRRATVKSKVEYGALLKKHGIEHVQITPWWKLFDRVLAVKNGSSAPVGETAKRLSEVLSCGTCGQAQWEKEAGGLRCQKCGNQLSITKEGIVLN
jgi:SAM-dependent methyltransferase